MVTASGLLGDERGEVEHLEDPVERHQRRHHIDVHVRQGGERTVEAGEQGGERDNGSDLEAAVDGEHTTPAVDEGGGERGGEDEREEEDPAVHGRLHADVADPSRPAGELARARCQDGRRA